MGVLILVGMLLDSWASSVIYSKKNGTSSTQHQHDGKTLFVIRHGQSEANICHDQKDREKNERYRDSKLTKTGVEQARGLQNHVFNWDVDLIIVSPLSRTIQTFCHAFEKHPNIHNIPIIIAPSVTEFYATHQECQGRDKEILLKDEILNQLTLFPRLYDSIKRLPNNWWSIGDDSRRLSHFSHLLHHTDARKICVVAHWGFIHQLFSTNPGKRANYSPDNCEWIYSIWKRNGDAYKRLNIPKDFPNYELEKYFAALETEHIIKPPQLTGLLTQDTIGYSKDRKYRICLLPGGNRHKNGLLNEIVNLQKNICGKFQCLKEKNQIFYVPISHDFSVSSDKELWDVVSCLKRERDYIVDKNKTWRVTTDLVELNVQRNSRNGNISDISFKFYSATMDTFKSHFSQELDWISDELSWTLEASVISLDDNLEQETYLQEQLSKYPCIDGAVVSHVDYGWDYLFKKLTWRFVLSSTDINGEDFQIDTNVSFPLW